MDSSAAQLPQEAWPYSHPCSDHIRVVRAAPGLTAIPAGAVFSVLWPVFSFLWIAAGAVSFLDSVFCVLKESIAKLASCTRNNQSNRRCEIFADLDACKRCHVQCSDSVQTVCNQYQRFADLDACKCCHVQRSDSEHQRSPCNRRSASIATGEH